MKKLLSVIAISLAMASVASAIDPVNDKCPVCGKPIRIIIRSNFKGQRIAFDTAECKDKFDKAPEKYPVKTK